MNKDQVFKLIESAIVTISASFDGTASILSGWNEYKNHIQEKNIVEILTIFFERLKVLENKIDQEYLKSMDLKALILKVCIYGKEEVVEEKRMYLANFLANSCVLVNSNDLTKIPILETLMKLSEFDILLMNAAYKKLDPLLEKMLRGQIKLNFKEGFSTSLGEGFFENQFPNYDAVDVRVTLQYLEGLGVIENIFARGYNPSIDSDIEDYFIKRKFEELSERRVEILQGKYRTKNYLDELNIIEEKIQNFSKDNSKKEIGWGKDKSYIITSLGIKILDYIK